MSSWSMATATLRLLIVSLGLIMALTTAGYADGRGWIIDGNWGTKVDGSDGGEEKEPCGQYCDPCLAGNTSQCAHPMGYCEGTAADVKRSGESYRVCYRGFGDFLELCRGLKTDNNSDCLSEIVIVGHGHDGAMGLGAGQSGGWADAQHKVNGNEEVWAPIFKKLIEEGILCPDGRLIFAACNFGAEQSGVDKLWKIVEQTNITCTATWHLLPRGQVDRALRGNNREGWLLINPRDPKPAPHKRDMSKEWVQ